MLWRHQHVLVVLWRHTISMSWWWYCGDTPSACLGDVMETHHQHVLVTLWRHTISMSWWRCGDTPSACLGDVVETHHQHVLMVLRKYTISMSWWCCGDTPSACLVGGVVETHHQHVLVVVLWRHTINMSWWWCCGDTPLACLGDVVSYNCFSAVLLREYLCMEIGLRGFWNHLWGKRSGEGIFVCVKKRNGVGGGKWGKYLMFWHFGEVFFFFFFVFWLLIK